MSLKFYTSNKGMEKYSFIMILLQAWIRWLHALTFLPFIEKREVRPLESWIFYVKFAILILFISLDIIVLMRAWYSLRWKFLKMLLHGRHSAKKSLLMKKFFQWSNRQLVVSNFSINLISLIEMSIQAEYSALMEI